MKVFLFALLLMMGLGGCASILNDLTAGIDHKSESSGFGTLADANDPVEMTAAPIINKLALYTHTVATHLKLSYITRDKAVSLRERERALRARIESAVVGKSISELRLIAAELDGYFNELTGV